MLRTVASIDKAQRMRARGDLYFSDAHTWIEGLIIERHEAYRRWKYDECVWLRTVWLLGGSEATEQPACPAKEEYEPIECSSHQALPRLIH
jgi:hypothetical protein